MKHFHTLGVAFNIRSNPIMSYFSTSYLYGLDDLNSNSLTSDFLLRSHDENYKSIMNSIQNTNRFGKILNAYSDPYSNGNLMWSREPYLPRILPYYRVNYLPQYNPYSLQSYYQSKPYQSEVLLPVLVPTYNQNNQSYFSSRMKIL